MGGLKIKIVMAARSLSAKIRSSSSGPASTFELGGVPGPATGAGEGGAPGPKASKARTIGRATSGDRRIAPMANTEKMCDFSTASGCLKVSRMFVSGPVLKRYFGINERSVVQACGLITSSEAAHGDL